MLYVEFMVINKNDKFISKLLTGFNKKFEYSFYHLKLYHIFRKELK